MKSRSIGNVALALLLLGCRPAGGGAPPSQHLFPAWVSQQRKPTSSHLRAVRFLNAMTGYVAGDATSIFRTTDGGLTWTQQEHAPLGRGGNIAALDFAADGTTVHVSAAGSDSAGGRWWTTGDGQNWTTPDVASTGFVAMTDVDMTALGTAYTLAQDGAIRHHTPSGVIPLSVGAAGTWLALEFSGATGYATGAGGAIRKTTDGGTTWSALASGTSAALRALSAVAADTVYACGDAGTVVKTTNGTTWAAVSTGLTVTLRAVHFVNSTTGWVVGDSGAVRWTADGGSTWNVPAIVPTGVSLHDVWFVDATTGYAVGEFGTVLRTSDGGVNWVDLAQGVLTTLHAVDFTSDGARGIAVGPGGAILRTLDGGATWTVSSSGVPVDLFGVSVPDAGSGNVAYACGAGGTILKTADFGGFWSPMSSGVSVALRAILFPAGDTLGYCAGDGSTILFTSSGTTWSPKSPPAADYYALASTFPALAIFAAGTGGRVAYTDLWGTFWYDRSVPAATTLRSLAAPGASTVVAGGDDGTIYRSLLNGQITTWEATTTGSVPNGVSFTSPSTGWAVNGGIFATRNTGTDWSLQYDHTPWTLRAIWMNAQGVGYAVGDNGTILHTRSGGF